MFPVILLLLCVIISVSEGESELIEAKTQTQLAGKCGVPFVERRRREPRIIGGVRAQKGEWPWQIALVQIDPSTNEIMSHHCGGALIGQNWVITAAHCLVDSYLKFVLPTVYWRISVGTTNLEYLKSHELYQVSRIILHQKFDRESWTNDVALIKMEISDGDVMSSLVPLCLPTAVAQQRDCTLTGWGRTEELGSPSKNLLVVPMPILSAPICQNHFQATHKLTENMFCAGDLRGGYGPCVGDSGSPLQCQMDDNRWVLRGVTSWGVGCAKHPAVFMNASNYFDWIKDHID